MTENNIIRNDKLIIKKNNNIITLLDEEEIDKKIPTKTSQLTNDSNYLTTHQDISGKEDKTNKVTSWSQTTSNDKYPSEKLVNDSLKNKIDKSSTSGLVKNDGTIDTNNYLTQHQDITGKEDKSNKVTSFSNPTDNQYPSAKLVNDSITDLETNKISKSSTIGLVKNDGTIDTNDYLTQHQDISGKVDKETGKGLSSNDYTTTEKNKLAGIETGANKTTVDSSLSTSSTNPVQNKVINSALNDLDDELNTKVDKVTGKGLSTEDYTTAEKTKLNDIEEGANNYIHPSYTARTGKPTSNQTPAFGGTATVSQIKSDATGHITSATDRTIKIPDTEASTTAHGLMSSTDKTKLDGVEIDATKNSAGTGLNNNNGELSVKYGTGVGTACQGNDSRLSDARTPKAHNQASSTITDTNTYSNIGNVSQNQQSINSAIDTKIGALLNVDLIEVVGSLSTASANTLNKLYLVAESTSATNDNYEIYITVKTGTSGNYLYDWEKVDTARLDLSDYATVQALNELASRVDDIINGDLDLTNFTITGQASKNVVTDSNGNITTENKYSHPSTHPATMITDSNAHSNIGSNANANQGAINTAIDTALSNKQAKGNYAISGHTHDDRYFTETEINTKLADKSDTTHGHGNINKDGAIGSTANLPVITDTNGVLKTGTFGNGANTFCQGNDSRLSDVRNPKFNAINASASNPLDLNNYRTGGFYYCNNDANIAPYIANCPRTGTDNKSFFLLVEYWNGSAYIKQTLTYYTTNITYTRTKRGGSDANTNWSKWEEVEKANYEYIVGTQTASTSTWTGASTRLGSIQAGTIIYYKLPYASTSTAVTLNLTLKDGTTTGAKNVWFWNNQRLTTHYGVNSVIGLIYNGTDWWVINPSSNANNNNYYLVQGVTITNGEDSTNFTAGNIVGATKDNKYYKLVSGLVLDVSYPLVDANGTINAGATSNNVHLVHPFLTTSNIATTVGTITANMPIYIEGDYYRGQFTISDKVIVCDNATHSTLTNNKYYIRIGTTYDATHFRFVSNMTVYRWDSTAGYMVPMGTSYTDLANKPTSFPPSSHNHDDRYFTETEINNKLADKAELVHTHYDTDINWGTSVNQVKIGSVSALDMAMYEEFSPNRLAFMSGNNVTVEYSTDGGSTWTATGTEENKRKLISTSNTFFAGENSTTDRSKNQLRITIKVGELDTNSIIYMVTRKLMLYLCTCGASNPKVTISVSTYKTPNNYTDLLTTSVSGWGGWNSIPFAQTIGGYANQVGSTSTRVQNIRLTFTQTGGSGNLNVSKIRLFGETVWNFPSNMARIGHIYDYDGNQNVTFPAKIIKSGGTSSQFLKADGSVDGTTYVATTDSRLSDTRTPTDGTVTTAKIVDSNVTTVKIADNAVTTAKIADKTIANGDIADSTIQIGKLNSNVYESTPTNNSTKLITSGGVKSVLDTKENTNNKSSSITTDTGSTTKYPTVKAIEDYAQPKYDFTGIKGTDNTEGYIKILQIKINATYQDKPIVIKTQHRDKAQRSVIQIKFINSSNTDPVLTKMTHTGQDMPFYLYKESTSTWSLISGKGHNNKYDNISVIVNNPLNGVTITKINTHLATLPATPTTTTPSTDSTPLIQSTYIGFTEAEKTKLAGIATGANNYSHPNSGVTAGTNQSSNQTPAFNATFNIPKLTFDAQGHITASANSTVKIPALPTASTSQAGIIQIGTGSSNASAGNHTHDDRYYTETEVDNIGVEYIEGTHGTTATPTWKGISTKISSLQKGQVIFFRMTSAGTSAGDTLELTLKDGSKTGNINIYYNASTKLTTHFPQHTILTLVYDGSKWLTTEIQNTNNIDRIYANFQSVCNASEKLIKNGIVCGKSDGLYYNLATAGTLDLRHKIGWTGAEVAVNGNTNNIYTVYPDVNLSTTKSGTTVVNYKRIYIEGTALSGSTFTISSSVFKDDTGLVNGNYYIPIGYSFNASPRIRFSCFENIVFHYTTSKGLVPYEDDKYAPISHATNSTTYGGGNSSNYGHVKLSDSYTSSGGNASQSVGASSKAVVDLKTYVDNLVGNISNYITS